MAESASYSTEMRTSGGFRIEVSPDELTITKSVGAWTYLIFGLVFFGFVVISLRRFPPFLFLVLAVYVFVYFYGRVHNLRCTREYLEVIDVFAWPRKARTRRYKRTDVRDIRRAVVNYDWRRPGGPIYGLVFNVGGERIPTLHDVSGREAQMIFDELQRLGYHISWDPSLR